MFTLMHERELDQLPDTTPQEVKAKISDSLVALDTYYGAKREIDDYGGCVVYIPHDKPFSNASMLKLQLKILNTPQENVNVIPTSCGNYLEILYMISSDYGVTVFVLEKDVSKWILTDL